MDVRCRFCGEPWDNDSIHDRVDELKYDGITTNYSKVYKAFVKNGCVELGGSDCRQNRKPNEAMSAIYDLMGDDSDGAMSLLEDADMMGLFE